MNAPIRRLPSIGDHGQEDFAAGSILLGYPWPDWVGEEHFIQRGPRLIFQAARELGRRACLPTIVSVLRAEGNLFTNPEGQLRDRHSKPHMLNSIELVDLMNQADWMMRQGWAVDWERLAERAKARKLADAMRRVLIQLEGEMVFDEAKAMLTEVLR